METVIFILISFINSNSNRIVFETKEGHKSTCEWRKKICYIANILTGKLIDNIKKERGENDGNGTSHIQCNREIKKELIVK